MSPMATRFTVLNTVELVLHVKVQSFQVIAPNTPGHYALAHRQFAPPSGCLFAVGLGVCCHHVQLAVLDTIMVIRVSLELNGANRGILELPRTYGHLNGE